MLGGPLTRGRSMQAINWDIRRSGWACTGDEAEERWQLTPEKFEMHDGRLFFDDEQRVHSEA